MPDRGHYIAFWGHQRAKIGVVSMQILGPTANRACISYEICTDPESGQVYRPSLELEFHSEFVVLSSRVPDWPGSKGSRFVPSFQSGRNTTVVVDKHLLLDLPFI